mgnify:CR=1 FL=1
MKKKELKNKIKRLEDNNEYMVEQIYKLLEGDNDTISKWRLTKKIDDYFTNVIKNNEV